jgi:hypothetical protein
MQTSLVGSQGTLPCALVWLVVMRSIQLHFPQDKSGKLATLYYFNFSSSWTLLIYVKVMSQFFPKTSRIFCHFD